LQTNVSTLKYKQIYRDLQLAIASGEYKEGQRLPSEAKLVEQFRTSRGTVARALQLLQHQGLVERRAGSGTYVRSADGDGARSHVFGLLIPDRGETEIFEPICQGMAQAEGASRHALLWGNTTHGAGTKEKQAEQLCECYIARRVSGVFFAPLELTPDKDEVNERIAHALDEAGIPVVLLDRCIYEYPRRSRYDLVGVDNRRAGFTVTEHLLKLGCRRIAFIVRPNSASTANARIAGYREALYAYGATVGPDCIRRGDSSDHDFVRGIMDELRPEAFVCANDHTAAHLMHSLSALGLCIPADVRIVGIDDVRYASLLPVPLTTLHQPCQDIGATAIGAMLYRITHPSTPARDILLDCKLIVRQSCGAALESGGESPAFVGHKNAGERGPVVTF